MHSGAADYNDKAQANNWATLCDASASFAHPDLRRLLGVWRRQARGGIPLRRDMTPRMLKSFRKDIVICERLSGEDGGRRYRVGQMGTSFAQILGDYTGRFLNEVLAPDILPRWQTALDAVLAEGAALRFIGRTDTNAMSFLIGEYFVAPLIADGGSASFVLSAGRFSGGRNWEEVETEERRALGLA